MAQVVFVNEAPKSVGKSEVVITSPTFLEQIKASNFRAFGQNLTSVNHLNQIITLIRNKFDFEGDLYEQTMKIPYSMYRGLPFQNNEDLSAIVVRILTEHCPAMLDKAVEWCIKNRPAGTQTIYFVGPTTYLPIFFQQGIMESSPPMKKPKPTAQAAQGE